MIQRHFIQSKCLHNYEGAVKPIIYYVDTSIPEPFFSAVIEGISWWDEAFRYAGYPARTIQVLGLPESVDPFGTEDFDRSFASSVNFVHWIHRDYRGYSVGQR